jgi:hypothetical protein
VRNRVRTLPLPLPRPPLRPTCSWPTTCLRPEPCTLNPAPEPTCDRPADVPTRTVGADANARLALAPAATYLRVGGWWVGWGQR